MEERAANRQETAENEGLSDSDFSCFFLTDFCENQPRFAHLVCTLEVERVDVSLSDYVGDACGAR